MDKSNNNKCLCCENKAIKTFRGFNVCLVCYRKLKEENKNLKQFNVK